jgi:hypothetical protein
MAKGNKRPKGLPRGARLASGKGETKKYLVDVKGNKVQAIDKKTGEFRENCAVIHFKRPKPVTTVRCEGSKLVAHNKRQCRNKKKKFVKCR